MLLRNQLKMRRREAGLTQAHLAQAVGVTRQSIIAIEKGKYKPSIELALKLAQVLSCPVEELFWLQETQGGDK